MEFSYEAATPKGEIKKGTIEATSKKKVIQDLQKKKLVIISIHQGSAKIKSTKQGVGKVMGAGRVPMIDKIIFVRNISVMLRSGLALTEALDAIVEQASSKRMKQVSLDILKNVNNGKTLADSLKKYPKIFGEIAIGMVQVGEASGTLEQNLSYVAGILEKDYELRRKVRAAMLYPIIILSGTFILGIGLSIFILPRLVRMFSTFRLELPPITKAFLGIANFLVDYGIFVLIGFVVLIVALRILVKSSLAKPFFHKLILRITLIKRISKMLNLARLSRAMSILLKSGVTINESLTIARGVVNNVCYKAELQRALKNIQQGKSLSSSLNNEEYVPKMARRMIGEGEKTGKLEDSFKYLAEFYEKDLDSVTKNLSSIIEPVLLIIIGVVLGFLVVAIISPIYQFTGQLGG
ncbi:type II secretion system F family protein [Patescibacteria group bacterium]|nr:type II secretion system F family protein [Patescibacteria group bacterium]MBU0964121.1 type II secretion system F family protein [Patescibacteria group bacterium]